MHLVVPNSEFGQTKANRKRHRKWHEKMNQNRPRKLPKNGQKIFEKMPENSQNPKTAKYKKIAKILKSPLIGTLLIEKLPNAIW